MLRLSMRPFVIARNPDVKQPPYIFNASKDAAFLNAMLYLLALRSSSPQSLKSSSNRYNSDDSAHVRSSISERSRAAVVVFGSKVSYVQNQIEGCHVP